MTANLVPVLFAAAGLIGAGAFITVWKRDLTAALAGVPVMLAGAGTALVGVSRFATTHGTQVFGQEVAALVAIVALSLVAIGVGVAGREGPR